MPSKPDALLALTLTVGVFANSGCGNEGTGVPGSAASASSDAAASGATSSASASSGSGGSSSTPRAEHPWITAYYAGWMESHLPIEEIDFTAMSHVAHFSWVPMPDGTLDRTSLGWSEAQATKLVAAAHSAGKKALLVVGGAWTREGFRAHLEPSRRAAFIESLVEGVALYGYDGVDVDMEPIASEDAPLFGAFASELRQALDLRGGSHELTAAVDWNADVFVPIQQAFDQLNLMTYDMSGAWEGWETWHNSPLHAADHRFASTGQPMPSIEGRIDRAIEDGAAPSKLGIGGVFYGYVWQGADGPNQPIDSVTVTANKPYHAIMEDDFEASAYRWHDGVEAAYLSLTGSTAKESRFVSFDDEKSIAAKVDWLRARGLGGMIVWELGGGYRPNLPAGQRHPLLAAVKAAAFGGPSP